MRVAILGLGLIGGSIARALARAGGHGITAWTPTGRGPAAALAEGIVDRAPATSREAIAHADLVVLAAPPLDCLGLLDELAGPPALPTGATITDVASTKAAIVMRADDAGLRFVGGHPMSGRETSGYEASSADLFEGRPWVIVPGRLARPADLDRVRALATAAGAVPMEMRAEDHDAAVAAISHLPLLVSAALVEAVARWSASAGVDPDAVARLAASGWRDMTRLALGDPAMGAGIVATNTAAISRILEVLRESLDRWAVDLEDGAPEPARVAERLAEARDALETMRRGAGA